MLVVWLIDGFLFWNLNESASHLLNVGVDLYLVPLTDFTF